MAADVLSHPPHLDVWADVDDDRPSVPEAPPPRWPVALEVLASPQARRAWRKPSDQRTGA